MAYNTKNAKNTQQRFHEELKDKQQQWQKDIEELKEEKTKLELEDVSLKQLLDDSFMENLIDKAPGQAACSALLDMRDRYKEIVERYKLLWPEKYAIKELNKKHAIVHSGQTYVLTEKNHPVFKGKDFSLESRQSFKMYYEDEIVLCSDGKRRSKADVWLKSPERRKYSDIIFDPTINIKSSEKDKYYNMWRGFSRKAKKKIALNIGSM